MISRRCNKISVVILTLTILNLSLQKCNVKATAVIADDNIDKQNNNEEVGSYLHC